MSDCYFSQTPFAITADPDSARNWAGRADALADIEKILRRLSRRDESSLDIIWANFGAGKSHSLFYLCHRIRERDPTAICVVVEVPEHVKNFREMYQRIVKKLPLNEIANAVLDARPEDASGDLQRAARAIAHAGPKEAELAKQWLSAEKPDLRQLKQWVGIGARIEDDATAADTLSSILTALNANGIRLCLMLDEFQRIQRLTARTRSIFTSSFRSLISANPRNFCLFVAIRSKLVSTAFSVVPEELRSIVGINKALHLPEMSRDDAVEFVRDRFGFFRPENFCGDEFAPFGRDLVEQGINALASSKLSMVPRNILMVMGNLYDELPEGDSTIGHAQAVDLVKNLNLDSVADDDD